MQEGKEFLQASGASEAIVETKEEINAPGGGKLWVRYKSIRDCRRAQALLHQQSYKGLTIMARFELGFDPVTKKRRICRNSIHTTCIRRIQQRRGQANNHKKKIMDAGVAAPPPANYSFKSLSIGEMEYPFPSGIYLTRMISLVQRWPLSSCRQQDDPLIKLVSNNYIPTEAAPTGSNKKQRISKNNKRRTTFGNSYAKEITESMAMVDATERALKLCLGRAPESFQSPTADGGVCARVYCVGDGKYPLTAATMALNYPYPGWEFVSIDPLMEPLIDTEHKLVQVRDKSQNYIMPPLPLLSPSTSSMNSSEEDTDEQEVKYVDIVLACHSHAPLQEFWDRVLERHRSIASEDSSPSSPCRAICVTMHCCADYSDLNQPPALVFEDFEVYSPKREIRIYDDCLSCTSKCTPE